MSKFDPKKHYERQYLKMKNVFGKKPDSLVQGLSKFVHYGNVIDLGAGEGRNSLYLASKGLDVTGTPKLRHCFYEFTGIMRGIMTTQKKGHRVAKDVRQQIIKRVKEEGIPVSQAAQEHGVSDKTIYTWLTNGASGNPTWSEIAKLKRENKTLLELVGAITMKLSETQKKN